MKNRVEETARYIYKVKDLPGEIWKRIPDFENYMVSNMGRVKSTAYERFYVDKNGCGRCAFYRETLRVFTQNSQGYFYVVLIKQGKLYCKRVNRLVLMTFAPCPGMDKMDACHKNDNPADNRLENLEWGTHKENCNAPRFKRLTGNAVRKRVVCDGVIYESITIAANALGENRINLNRWIGGTRTMPEKYKAMGLAYIS